MSKWDFILNKLGKAAPKVAKEEDMFPAIKALLKKEQGKEAAFGTNNPVIDAFGGGGDADMMELKRVINKSVPSGDLATLKFGLNPGSAKKGLRRNVDVGYMFPEGKKPTLNFTRTDEDTASYYADHLTRQLDNQPIFWADDVAGAATKKGIPKIEDALIREREREKLFNTNNPLNPDRVEGDVATELRQLKDSPSGAHRFQSVNKWLEDSSGQFPAEMRKAVEEQLQGKRFFFPVKANIKESDPAIWLAQYLNSKPTLSNYNRGSRTWAMREKPDSYPWIDGPNIFFDDGTKI